VLGWWRFVLLTSFYIGRVLPSIRDEPTPTSEIIKNNTTVTPILAGNLLCDECLQVVLGAPSIDVTFVNVH
jgi:hypothetical protein